MAPVVLPGVDIPLLTGPLVLGYMWSYCLYGMLIVQTYFYSEMFPKDSRGIKILVYTMFVMETIFSLFTTIAAWNSYGPGWGDIDTLLVLDWSWTPLPILNAVLAGMAQSFYIWRIWSLMRGHRYIPIFIGAVMVMQVTVCFHYTVIFALAGRKTAELGLISAEVSAWLGGSAACDLLITITLVTILSYQKRHTTFAKTTGLINKMIRFSVETGAITTLAAVCDLTLWLSTREFNIHFIFFFVLGKLYSNVLMATLNFRAPIFRSEAFGTNAAPQSSLWADPSTANTSAIAFRPGVHVSQTTNVARDQIDTIVMSDFTATSTMDAKGTIPDKSY
ncbi:hypothetical protein B0H17DRAFT_1066030 [Mycena rosella]|uniref:DUF6534 domain-containing protein n=1 Tax=Mycena rosella TaxID=1033263 RepID=A0AAD7DF22_MYCRO|nr:hypothetical protein B0H17DRAFT_1066030 [Mycena rosella]